VPFNILRCSSWATLRIGHYMWALHSAPHWDLDSRYSSWLKLRITAYLYRFLNRIRPAKTALSHAAILHPEEIQKVKRLAQNHAIRHISQWNLSFNPVSVKNSPLHALNLYFDEDGLIHIRGWLRRACLPEATKNPIVLRAHPLLVHII